MSTNDSPNLQEFCTTAESPHDHEDGASAEECWCTDTDGPPCFAAFQAEKRLRGEH